MSAEKNEDDWQKQASCKNVEDSSIFFHNDETDTTGIEAAKVVCAGCVVISDCLEAAVANGEEGAVWGGATDKERRKLIRIRRLQSNKVAASL